MRDMRQLTSLDHQFLALESRRQTGHVAGLAILDTSGDATQVTCRSVKQLVRSRLPALPPLRWRVVEVPLNLDYPYWVEDEEFDLDFHVRELALAAPGNDEQLAEQVSRIVSRPLDRSRPLWELYVIEGVEGGRTAMLTKIHHALIDGMSGAEIMGLLLDLSPEGTALPPVDESKSRLGGPPGQLGMLARGALGVPRYPLRVLRALPRALPNTRDAPAVFGTIPGADTVGRLASRVRGVVSGADTPSAKALRAPRTTFSKRISAHRRFAFGQLSLDEVKDVKNRYGVTVNDLVVSICAGAVRRWLIEHDELPDEPLVAQIPVSVRTDEERGTYGNRILLMRAPLFTNVADPVRRLELTHEEMSVVKQRHKALPASLLQDANHFIPPAVFHRAAQLTFRVTSGSAGRPNWNLVISNVPGPQFPLYCAGARLEAQYPVSVITDGMGLNITVMSYCGHLDFGIVADREQMPDVWNLIGWLGEALDELKLQQPSPVA
ncbi:MAG: diacylglycerol O-acyltransferase / wax synthase [Solirubrobacteraceae bacterium]|jgi:WS/DGAT/MGAT family acyltransferase|nr:diacylglycerol O-acyltransferase / wax synthase [Solirubrobacteraceae bacterium]